MDTQQKKKKGKKWEGHSSEKEWQKKPHAEDASLNGVKQFHLKFFTSEDSVPTTVGRVDIPDSELAARALQHTLAPGKNPIQNIPAVTPRGVAEQIIALGFSMKKFSFHVKETLHQGRPRAVVEAIFTPKDDREFPDSFKWRDSELGVLLRCSWTVHVWINPSGITTINFVHRVPLENQPARNRLFIADGIIGMRKGLLPKGE